MPGAVIGIDLNFGFLGSIARHGDEFSRARLIKEGTGAIPFGAPVFLNADGTVQGASAAATADKFAGVAIRKVKSATEYFAPERARYEEKTTCDILERGSIIVDCPTGVPTAGGDVYVRIVTNGAREAGEFSADAVAGETIKLEGVKFGGAKDTKNAVELVIVERQGV